jgi:hypothetical protein
MSVPRLEGVCDVVTARDVRERRQKVVPEEGQEEASDESHLKIEI